MRKLAAGDKFNEHVTPPEGQYQAISNSQSDLAED